MPAQPVDRMIEIVLVVLRRIQGGVAVGRESAGRRDQPQPLRRRRRAQAEGLARNVCAAVESL
jgi:hypothetical protein